MLAPPPIGAPHQPHRAPPPLLRAAEHRWITTRIVAVMVVAVAVIVAMTVTVTVTATAAAAAHVRETVTARARARAPARYRPGALKGSPGRPLAA